MKKRRIGRKQKLIVMNENGRIAARSVKLENEGNIIIKKKAIKKIN